MIKLKLLTQTGEHKLSTKVQRRVERDISIADVFRKSVKTEKEDEALEFTTEQQLLFCILTGQHKELGKYILQLKGQTSHVGIECSSQDFEKVMAYINNQFKGGFPRFPFLGKMTGLQNFGSGIGDYPCFQLQSGQTVGQDGVKFHVEETLPRLKSMDALTLITCRELLHDELTQRAHAYEIEYTEKAARRKSAAKELQSTCLEAQQYCLPLMKEFRQFQEKRAKLSKDLTPHKSATSSEDAIRIEHRDQKFKLLNEIETALQEAEELLRTISKAPKTITLEIPPIGNSYYTEPLEKGAEECRRADTHINELELALDGVSAKMKSLKEMNNSEGLVFSTYFAAQFGPPKGRANLKAEVFNQKYDNLKTATAQILLGINHESAREIFEGLANKKGDVDLSEFLGQLNPIAVY